MMKVFVFEVGKIKVPDKDHLTAGRGGMPITIPVVAYLIEHPKGRVLVDTGMNPDVWPPELKQSSMMRPEQKIDSQLLKLGLEPEDIDYTILTHMHLDHAGGMTLFPNATFIVRKTELRFAWWPDRWLKGWVYEDYKDTRDYKYIQLDDIEDFDLFMDGSIVCIDSKGHTPGHQSVLVDLPNSGKMLFAGDAVHTAENLYEAVMPGHGWNPDLMKKNMSQMRQMQANGVKVIMGHDPAFFKTLKLAPDYYD